MPLHEKKVIAVLPAYNAERTLQATYDDIPKDWVDEILLVDDCSRDRTVELSRELGIKTVVHQKNRGYGGNQKTCYKEALRQGADIVIMLHPDYQYTPRLIGAMGFPGCAVGGLSVGEPKETLWPMLAASLAALPADRPRYVMGLGAPGWPVGVGFEDQ